MNYQKIYDIIIDRSKNRILEGYVEKHHIIPECLGGTDDPSNLVVLTAREHYIVHQLLVKMYPDNHKLIYAANMMTVNRYNQPRNNRTYDWLKKRRAAALSKELLGGKTKFSTTDKKWITNGKQNKLIHKKDELPDGWKTGRTLNEHAKNQITKATRKPCSVETKNKISQSKLGGKHTEETKRKISESRKIRKQ
jgi:hypothetical protein